MVRGKKAGETVSEPQGQNNLLEVERSEAAREADRWAEINADLEGRKELLVTQTEKVLQAMKKAEQRTMMITDQMGYKHTFAIVNAGEKLRHSKREEN